VLSHFQCPLQLKNDSFESLSLGVFLLNQIKAHSADLLRLNKMYLTWYYKSGYFSVILLCKALSVGWHRGMLAVRVRAGRLKCVLFLFTLQEENSSWDRNFCILLLWAVFSTWVFLLAHVQYVLSCFKNLYLSQLSCYHRT
jgi:hypothetical protein